MSAKLRELMLKHVYYVPKDRRIGPILKKTRLVKTTKLKVLLESDVTLSSTRRAAQDHASGARVVTGLCAPQAADATASERPLSWCVMPLAR